MSDVKKNRQHRRCAWCPKDAEVRTALQCPRCKRWYCPPELRDCMLAHRCK